MEYVKKEVKTAKELGEVFNLVSKLILEVRKASKDGLQYSDFLQIIMNSNGDLANAIVGVDKVGKEFSEDMGASAMTALIGAGEIISAFKQPV
jgi:hypothetical protein